MSFQLLRHWFAQPLGLGLLMATPLVTIAALMGLRWRRQRLLRLGRLPAVIALAGRGQGRTLRGLCLLLALTALAIGVAGPQWGREAERVTSKGRDLLVVLDLSRSMLADDVAPDPSRSARARQALRQLADSVQRRGGHRLGLVAFATRAEVVCPLTHDYDHFRDRLAELDPAYLPNELRAGFHRPGEPEPRDVSGTRLGAGLLAAVEAHDPRFAGFQDILLLSDGDDPVDDREWLAGARAAANRGMPIYVVGIGDPVQGGRIPTPDGYYLTREGQPYWSKLNEQPLQEIARLAAGAYLPARTGPLRLDELFETQIEPGPKREAADDALPPYRQRYGWFYAAALGLLALEMTIGGLRRSKAPFRRDPVGERGQPARLLTGGRPSAAGPRVETFRKLTLMLLAMFLLGAAAAGTDPFALVRQGNAAFASQDYQRALDLYEQAEGRITDPGLVAFNKGAALYRLGRFREAELHYRRSLEDATGPRRARLLYDLGNCLLQQSAGSDARLLQQAVACYRQALAEADAGLAADLRHNFELAKLLWLRARASRPKQEQPSSSDTKDPPPQARDGKTPQDVQIGSKDSGTGKTPPPIQKVEVDPGKQGQAIPTSQPPPPGSSSQLGPVPDKDELTTMDRQDTLRHLQRAADLIQRERREHLKRSAPLPPRGVMDW